MIFSKVFTITLAVSLTSAAQAASLKSLQAPVEAAKCIEGLKQVASLASDTNHLLKTKTLDEFAGIADLILIKEKNINQNLVDAQSACCSNNSPSGVFSEVDVKSVYSGLQEVFTQLQTIVTDFATNQVVYKGVSYYAYSMPDFFKLYGKTTDSLVTCITPRLTGFSDQIQNQKAQFDAVLKKATENEQQPFGANGETIN